MAADLVTRLKLDDKQFNDNIRKSKQQIQQFQASAKAVGTALKTFSIMLIGVETAMDAFNKAVTASKGINDLYEESMRAAATSVNEFFYSITTGDFTFLSQGLGDIIDKARQAQKAITDLANTKISFGYFDSKWSSALEDAINRAKDLSLTEEERNKAIEEANALVAKLEGGATQVQKALKNTIKNSLTEGTLLNADDISLDDFEKILEINLKVKGSDAYKNELESQYATYKKLVGYAKQGKDIAIGGVYYEGAEAVKLLNARYKDSILYNEMLKDMSKEELQNVVNLAMEYHSLSKKIVEYKNKLLELNNPLVNTNNGGGTTSVKVAVTPEFKEGSLGYLEKQIQDKQLEFKYATDITSRNRIKKEIEELTKKKRYIEIEYTMSQPLTESKTSFASMVQMPDFKNVKLGEVTKGINNETKKGVKNLDAYCSALNAASNATSAFINNKFEDSGEGWTQWSANVLASIASTIAALQALCMAEGVKSVFKLPFPANIAAIATVLAAITSAFAAFPTFADGGIFQSYLTTGDKNLARLNGGEMILNKGQQANLFNLLDKGTPLGNGGNVTFKIEGKQLVGVLNNYNNKRSKVL